ncbi:MAG: hypothetical protein Q8R37_02795 [Nanoarchaeota archaeon]|nr:hypothetical protein [Nanoarchaeota archaeon]
MVGFKQQLGVLNHAVASCFNFVGSKLTNFKNLSLGEQVSYSSIGVGMILIMVAVVLFII